MFTMDIDLLYTKHSILLQYQQQMVQVDDFANVGKGASLYGATIKNYFIKNYVINRFHVRYQVKKFIAVSSR